MELKQAQSTVVIMGKYMDKTNGVGDVNSHDPTKILIQIQVPIQNDGLALFDLEINCLAAITDSARFTRV